MGRKPQGRPYDPQIRRTEHGSRLYTAWKKMRLSPHCEEWEDFYGFYTWAMKSDYTLGAWLRLVDESDMYCPDNVFWHIPGSTEDTKPTMEWAAGWDKTVNRIRKHYGMPPLRGTSYGD